MYSNLDFSDIIIQAWQAYDPTRSIRKVRDMSVRVSTNHVFRVSFGDGGFVYAKCSYFGKYEHFREDHQIINRLANNLPAPYDNFLSRSLTKDDEVFTYRYRDGVMDVWVVFYSPIDVDRRPPKKMNEKQIHRLGEELAKFHMACSQVRKKLPPASKTMESDVLHLLDIIKSDQGKFEHRGHIDDIRRECDLFLANSEALGYREFETIPVFVDWNIGNFSVTKDFDFFSRWDYDWFRVSSRVMDFYFFARVCSSVGDRTTFSYFVDPFMEDRFRIFLKAYHAVSPLTREEILFMKEVYRFFILNYVIKYGRYFFHHLYSTRLMHEAYTEYFPTLDSKFNAEEILHDLHDLND